MQKWIHRLFLGVIALATGLILWFYWTLFSPMSLFKVTNSPVPLVGGNIVKAGTQIQYIIDYCKYVPITGEIHRQLVDTVTIPLESYQTDSPVGCETGKKSIPVTIPGYIQPGRYKISIHAIYHPYPWRTVDYQFETETFDVVK